MNTIPVNTAGRRGFKLTVDKLGKDQGKANHANAFIGFGVPHRKSSTGAYKMDALRQGIPVNHDINPSPDTVAFVSLCHEGLFNTETIALAKKVIAAGGTVIMDAQGQHRGQSHSSYNKTGEGKVQDGLGNPQGITREGYTIWGNPKNIR
ncbi:hypothetical protein OH491_24785 [Termitidicoccus mucosus]|uniref:Uncharacterized protein n=1 Tax=Termitidicoccus mucosus TaxID=1184151 RepID=A0A178IQH8_9BACT|nr:hypothetical protein AW736_01740 [Opitutaceae bacterium TSB47]